MLQFHHRFKFVLVAIALAGAACYGLSYSYAQPNATHKTWHSDFRKAYKEAQNNNRPLLIHFYADWCGPCKKMDREVLYSSKLSQLVNKNYVAVKVNADHNQDIIQHFGIKSLPSDVIIDPNGKVLQRNKGYLAANVYLAGLHSVSRSFNATKKSSQSHNSKKVPSKALPNSKPGAVNSVKVGLNGFCPVSLKLNKQWDRGNPKFNSSYQNVVYFFTSDKARAEFRKHPEDFAPEYLGCDPVILTESGHAVPGTTNNAAYSKGRLFLFLIPETRARFQRNPDKYLNRRHALNIEEIEHTADASVLKFD